MHHFATVLIVGLFLIGILWAIWKYAPPEPSALKWGAVWFVLIVGAILILNMLGAFQNWPANW